MKDGPGAGAKGDDRARKTAYRLLRHRPRSIRELYTRLQKTFSEETCRTVIRELQERHLLDDFAFSRFWIENRTQFKPVGRARLFQELSSKGVDRAVIQEALDAGHPAEEALAERLLTEKKKRWDLKEPGSARRMYRFLRSRGFSHGVVSDLLGKGQQGEADVQDDQNGE